MLSRGKVRLSEDQTTSINVFDSFLAVAAFTQRVLGTEAITGEVNLRAFVDGLEEKEEI